MTHSDGSSIVNSYLPDGTLSAIQDEKHTSANTSYSYDGANRMGSVTQTLVSITGGQIVTRYAYDLGNLTSVLRRFHAGQLRSGPSGHLELQPPTDRGK